MLDEEKFRRHADRSIESLKQALIAQEAEGGFEVEENNGALQILFDEQVRRNAEHPCAADMDFCAVHILQARMGRGFRAVCTAEDR